MNLPIKPFDQPILVTRPALPALEDFCAGLKTIWENQWLTNSGPLHQQFQTKLQDYLRGEHICLLANGTLALQLGLQALGLPAGSEVITTPFTFVATAHAIKAAGLTPVFCDIKPEDCNLDPEKVIAAITPRTSAILAVHVFGHPCDVHALEEIANHHGLRLVFDAAHAFGIEVDGRPISDFGDMSMFSLHATKIFHSAEGGVLVCPNEDCRALVDRLKNFGFHGGTRVDSVGTNAKMSELHALMGLLLMDQIEKILDRYRQLAGVYRECLADVPGIRMPGPRARNIVTNDAYVPIEIESKTFGTSRDELHETLRQYNVFARRYFFPLLTDFPCYQDAIKADDLTIARHVADRILCLPISSGLTPMTAEKISTIISRIGLSR